MARRRLSYLSALAALACLVVLLGLVWAGDKGGSVPVVVTGSATVAGTGSSAQPFLTGTVDPRGLEATYRFEYVAAAEYKPGSRQPYAAGSAVPASPAAIDSGADGKPVTVKATLSRFKPNTTYHYRVVAENSEGISQGDDETFLSPATCQGPEGKCVWSTQLPADAEKAGVLEDVACPSLTSCVAVGSDRYAEAGYAELWNGNRWKMVGKLDAEMKAVSCPTTTWCMAVGNNPAKSWNLEWRKPSTGAGEGRIEANPPPYPKGASELILNDVFCLSETDCTVVGIFWRYGYKTYVARWNGRDWKFESAVNRSRGVTHGMLGVSCPTATFCVAVGAYLLKPFVQHWDGKRWKVVSVPYPPTSTASLEGVSCTSPRACMAVGNFTGSSGISRPFSARWNGSDWSVVRTAALSKAGYGNLRSVSCLSAMSCISVGSIAYPLSDPKAEMTIAETWNGTEWTLQSTPDPRAFSFFAGVSCTSAVTCTAVGQASSDWEGPPDAATLVARFE